MGVQFVLRLIASVFGILIANQCFSDSTSADQVCHLDAASIRVDYMEERHASNGLVSRRRPIILYRYRNQVAIEYPEQGITEKWEQVKNKRIKLTRYFNGAQRGIEYQPGELVNNVANRAANNDWSMHWQLISDTLIASMTEEKSRKIKVIRRGVTT